ncbi:MAG: hypothetical protein IJR27_03705 [Synergistaceae bacterium]|nr:hypothetical protein [Synergistaceae bacterium]MBQ9574365.1 hypothetical protein [Synergistaceae bacterium]
MIQKITTERIKVSNSGEGMSEALAMTEKTVGLMHLTERNRLRARLLAEEMFNMVRTIAVDFSAEFWIEQTEDRICTLHLEAKSALDYAKRQELISASTTGKNSARLGIMDKIRGMFEAGLYGIEESFRLQAEYGTGMFTYGALGIPDDGMTDALYSWSMQKYKKDVEAEKDDDPESWDELEKSIIANIADDVQVGILKDKIELIVVKKF